MDKRIFKILATTEARDVVKATANELGMKEQIVAGRIYEWFAAQDDAIKKGVLKLLPKGYEPELARLALERLAKGEQNGKGKGR